MTMRKPNTAEQMAELKNEIETVESFMLPRVKEAEALDAIRKTRALTSAERKRGIELIEYIHEKNCWLAKANDKLKAFYGFTAA